MTRYFHRVPRYNGKANSGYRGGSRKGLDLTVGTPDSSAPSHSSSSPPIPVRVVSYCDPSEGFPTRSWYRVLLFSSTSYCGVVGLLASPNSLKSGSAKYLLSEHLRPKTPLQFQRLSSLALSRRTLRLRSTNLRVSASISRTHLRRIGVCNTFANHIDFTFSHDFSPRTVAGKRSWGFTTTA
jgi:hypothetical protein